MEWTFNDARKRRREEREREGEGGKLRARVRYTAGGWLHSLCDAHESPRRDGGHVTRVTSLTVRRFLTAERCVSMHRKRDSAHLPAVQVRVYYTSVRHARDGISSLACHSLRFARCITHQIISKVRLLRGSRTRDLILGSKIATSIIVNICRCSQFSFELR